MSKTLLEEAQDVKERLERHHAKNGGQLSLDAYTVIGKLMDRVPKRKKKAVNKSKAQAKDADEIAHFLAAQLNFSPADAKQTGVYLWMHWTENGWKRGSSPIRDWKLTVRKWHTVGYIPVSQKGFAKKKARKEQNHERGW